MDSGLFILTHKNISYDIPNGFKLLQVGASLSPENIGEYKDNSGENISKKNNFFLETTGIYWIWKNIHTKIKGQMQYRRFLNIENIDIEKTLDNYDIIVANPFDFYPIFTVETQYGSAHDIKDIQYCKNIISVLYPDYISSYEKYIEHGRFLIYSNSFIAKEDVYNKLCEFCFNILFKFEKDNKFYNKDILTKHAKEIIGNNKTNEILINYQSRIGGALFERLVTLYIYHNIPILKPYFCGNYIKKENLMKM